MSSTEPATEVIAPSPWYRNGLAFSCTRCGGCCTGVPGFVWVNVEEIARLAAFLGATFEAFAEAHVRRVGPRYSLKEQAGGDCIFWNKQAGCSVYAARPVQCQTWPFWPENIESRARWEQVTAVCPGSGHGQWFSVEEIRAKAARVHTV